MFKNSRDRLHSSDQKSNILEVCHFFRTTVVIHMLLTLEPFRISGNLVVSLDRILKTFP